MNKPGELIDFRIRGLDKLTKADLDVENRLLRHALRDKSLVGAFNTHPQFVIRIRDLKTTHDSNDRIDESLLRLQQTVMQIRTGSTGLISVPKLGAFARGEVNGVARGMLRYSYPRDYIETVYMSTFWGRLDVELMSTLPSKYAYRLFEIVSRRIGLKVQNETFTPEDMRDVVLGVPKGKLPSSNDLWRKAISPAIEHVNRIAPFMVEVSPVVEKRKTTAYKIHWSTQDSAIGPVVM